jgi:hypothetical protein
MPSTAPESRISCLVAEDKHETDDDREGGNLVPSYQSRVNLHLSTVSGGSGTYDATW